MSYYLNIDDDGYLLSVSSIGSGTSIDSLDEYDLSGRRINAYRWDGESLVFDEERYAKINAEETQKTVVVTQLDRIEAQVAYTAMMTGTLLEA